jgi:hypothetical protein
MELYYTPTGSSQEEIHRIRQKQLTVSEMKYLSNPKCKNVIKTGRYVRCGPGSSVGITTDYGAGRSGDRIPVRARFSAPVQCGSGAHPASCTSTMGTGSFPGVESGRGVTLTPHPLLVPRSKTRAIPLLSLRVFVAYKKGETYLDTFDAQQTSC